MREDAERVFRDNYDDYGRKLYLIENCIYGVDIQPIAVQIAKMRFFISLIVDQRVNSNAPNRGVRALPNLETKFVAANTLIGIDRPRQKTFRNPEIDSKEAELRKVREKHFTARTLKSKAKCRDADKRLRDGLADLLQEDGWDDTIAKQLAAWDPYDQNAHAEFFDPEWMFALPKGFDVVIGNPPYLESRSPAFTDDMKQRLRHAANGRWPNDAACCITRGSDLLVYFLERSVTLMNRTGNAVLITQNAWLDTDYGRHFQEFLLSTTHVSLVVDSDFKHFDSSVGPNINTVVTFFRGRIPENKQAITFARFTESLRVGALPSNGERISKLVHNVEYRQYQYDAQTLRSTKWGVLLSLDVAALDWLAALEERGPPIERVPGASLTVGQGLNLTKAHFITPAQVQAYPFVTTALIPVFTSADGAPFHIAGTCLHLVTSLKLTMRQSQGLREAGIMAFDPRTTRKPLPH